MLYIVCALPIEAKSLVLPLSLRKDQFSCPYETYLAEDHSCVLVVSGPGAIAASAATTYLLTRFGFKNDQDFLLNFGSCAGEKGGLYLIHKIIDQATSRTFYPDMCYDLSVSGLTLSDARAVTTCYQVVSSLEDSDMLYDMEASGIYQAASRFVPPHRMVFLKFVSDAGIVEAGQLTPEALKMCADTHATTVLKVMNTLRAACTPIPTFDEALYNQTALDLCASETMSHELRQLFRYALTSDQDMENLLQTMKQDGKLPVSSKREGKVVLDEIRQHLL